LCWNASASFVGASGFPRRTSPRYARPGMPPPTASPSARCGNCTAPISCRGRTWDVCRRIRRLNGCQHHELATVYDPIRTQIDQPTPKIRGRGATKSLRSIVNFERTRTAPPEPGAAASADSARRSHGQSHRLRRTETTCCRHRKPESAALEHVWRVERIRCLPSVQP
jgi:hypothetical protein